MSEENKALARRILEDLVVKLNLDNLEDYFATDVVVHVPFLDLPPGLEGLRSLYSSFPGAIADVELNFDKQHGIGNQAAEFGNISGLENLPDDLRRRQCDFRMNVCRWQNINP